MCARSTTYVWLALAVSEIWDVHRDGLCHATRAAAGDVRPGLTQLLLNVHQQPGAEVKVRTFVHSWGPHIEQLKQLQRDGGTALGAWAASGWGVGVHGA